MKVLKSNKKIKHIFKAGDFVTWTPRPYYYDSLPIKNMCLLKKDDRFFFVATPVLQLQKPIWGERELYRISIRQCVLLSSEKTNQIKELLRRIAIGTLQERQSFYRNKAKTLPAWKKAHQHYLEAQYLLEEISNGK